MAARDLRGGGGGGGQDDDEDDVLTGDPADWDRFDVDK
jgi:hypothetical protein